MHKFNLFEQVNGKAGRNLFEQVDGKAGRNLYIYIFIYIYLYIYIYIYIFIYIYLYRSISPPSPWLLQARKHSIKFPSLGQDLGRGTSINVLL